MMPVLLMISFFLTFTSHASSIDEFEKTLDQFISKENMNLEKANWWPKHPNIESLYENRHDSKDHSISFPYVKKLILPANSEILMIGDLHGDVQTVQTTLEFLVLQKKMRLKKGRYLINTKDFPLFHIIFLGDYTDRGWHPIETLKLVLDLKNDNPQKVHLIRGNHEDIVVNKENSKQGSGLYYALSKKGRPELIKKIHQAYEKLPLAIFLGTQTPKGHLDYVQLNHGGLELGLNPALFLEKKPQELNNIFEQYFHLEETKIVHHYKIMNMQFPNAPDDKRSLVEEANGWPVTNGFMWGDFHSNDIYKTTTYFSNTSRGVDNVFDFDFITTKFWLNFCSNKNITIRSVFRAHQQNDSVIAKKIAINGVARLWDEFKSPVLQNVPVPIGDTIVFTLDVAPINSFSKMFVDGGIIPNFNYTANHVILKTATSYQNWTITILRMKGWDVDDLEQSTDINPRFLGPNTPLKTAPYSYYDDDEW